MQEFKLLHALQQAGVPVSWIDAEVELAVKAKTPEEMDAIRLRLAQRLVPAQHVARNVQSGS